MYKDVCLCSDQGSLDLASEGNTGWQVGKFNDLGASEDNTRWQIV